MFRKNVAGQVIHFQGVDSATGGIKSGVTWTVRRCIDGTFAAGGGTVTEDGSTGWYKYAMSQADTNGNNIGFNFTGTGVIPQTVNIITTAADPSDAVRLGLTALPNANAEAAGGLYTRGTGAGQINQPANGMVDANATRLGGTTQTGRDIGASVLLSSGTGAGQLDFTSGVVKANLAQILGTALTETAGQIAAAFKKFFDKASPTGTINSLPDAVAGAGGGLALVGSDVGTATSVTGSVGSVTAGVTVTTNNDKTGYGLSSAAVQAIWDALTSALTTAGSIGKWILDKLDVVVSTRLASASYTAPLDAAGTRSAVGLASANLDTQLSTIDDFLDTEIAAIKAKTDNLPASPAAVGSPMTLEDDAVAAAKIAADAIAEIQSGLSTLDAAGVRDAVGLASANLDTRLTEISDKTDNLPASPAAIEDVPTASDIALAVRNSLLGKPANVIFMDPGGAATEGPHLWDGSHTNFPTVDTTNKPPEAYSSLKFAAGQEIEVLALRRYRRMTFHFMLDALPVSGNEPFLEISDFQDFAIAFITVTSERKLAWSNPTSTNVVAGNTAISVNTWYRVAVAYDGHDVADNLELKIFLDGLEQVSVVAGDTNGVSFSGEGLNDRLRPFNDVSGRNVWLSHIYVDDGADLGDPGNIRVTAKLSTTPNVDDFDTTGGTGAVNERPLSETNYRQQAGTTQVRQNYNLQGAADGDVDISKAMIVGYMGWTWGNRSGGLASMSAKLTVNGKDYPTILANSPSVKRQVITDTVYPTDPAAIGLISTGSALDTFLYECGIVVAYTDPVFPTVAQVASAVWDEDIVTEHQTADSAGKKLSQALVLYEGD